MTNARLPDGARSRFFPVLLIFISVQGAILISQGLASLYLSAGEVGIVRAVESAIALLVLATSVGAPSLAVRLSAIEGRPEVATAQLRRLVAIVVAAGLLGWVSVTLFQALFVPGAIPGMIAGLAGVAVLTNIVRVFSAHAQGSADVAAFARRIAVMAVVSVVTTAALGIVGGVEGWLLGRYVGEAIMCAGILKSCGPEFWRPATTGAALVSYRDLVRDGVLVNLALIVRLLADSLAILGLTALKTPTDIIGHFGLASLVMMLPTLIFAVLTQASYPVIVLAREVPERRRRELARLAFRLLAVAIISVTGVVLADRYVVAYLPVIFVEASALAVILALALPLRALALTVGSYFMATEQYRLALAIGIVEVVLGAALLLPAISRYGVTGAAWLVVFMAAISALLFGASYWHIGNRGAHATR